MLDLTNEFNRIQRTLEKIKANIWHFSENSDTLDARLLGTMLNKSFETNYFKVKNLSRSLKDPTTYHQIFLQNNFKEE